MTWLKVFFGKIPTQTAALIAVFAGFGLFLVQQWVLTEKLSVEKRIANIKQSGYFLRLDTWQSEFYLCANPLDCPNDASSPKKWIFGPPQDRPHPANFALLTYQLPEGKIPDPKDWPYLALVIPRSLHQTLSVQIGETHYPVFASHGQTIHINVATSYLSQYPYLKLRYDLGGYPRFGPLDFPIALVDAKHAQNYADSAATLETRAMTGRDWQIAVPLLIAFIMLWINHAPVYNAFALYGMAFSLRSGLYFLAENDYLKHWQPWLCLAHLLTIATLIKFLSLLAGTGKTKERKFLAVGLLLTVGAGIYVLWLGERVSTDERYLDLIADCVLGLVGISLLVSAFLPQKAKTDTPSTPTVADLQHLSVQQRRGTHLASLALAASALFVLLAENGYNFIQLNVGGQKSPLDILIIVHFLGLCAAVFVRLGPTRQLISSQGKLLARYLAKSREKLRFSRLMASLISANLHYDHDGITWQVIKSSEHLVGGDWHDLRVLTNKERKILVCALFDVTGHDLLAAGHHVLIAAHWHLALSQLQIALNLGAAASPFLSQFAGQWLQGLNALCFHAPGKLGASGAILLWDLSSEAIHVAAAGQRSLTIVDVSGRSSLLHFASDRLGVVVQGHFSTKSLPANTVSRLEIASDGAEPLDQQTARDDATRICIVVKKPSEKG